MIAHLQMSVLWLGLVLCCRLVATNGNEPPSFEANMDYHVISENTPVGKEIYTLKGLNGCLYVGVGEQLYCCQ